MEKNVPLVILLVSTMLISIKAVDVPDFLHVCKRNDPNIVACITESVEFLKPYLRTGVPEYNIPALEPLVLKELVAAEGTGGLRVTARDVHVYGASNFRVTKLKIDLDQFHFTVDVGLPNINIEGLYEIDGKVLLLPIRGSGPMSGNFTSCTGAVQIQCQVERGDDGDDHMQIVDFSMKISVGQGNIQLDNLFGGEKVLGDVINSAINSNFNTFVIELQPLIERALSDAFFKISNSIVSQFSYHQLFPES